MVKSITRPCKYVQGYLKYGYQSLDLIGDAIDQWDTMSEEEKNEFFDDHAEIVVTEYVVEDYEEGDELYEEII